MTYKDPDKQREAKCSNCGKEVAQTEGKRSRLYCDDACRKRMKRRTAHKLNQMADVINGQIINGHLITDKQGVTITKAESHVDASDISTVKALHQMIKAKPEQRPSVMMDEQGVINIEQGVTNGAKIHLPEQSKPKRGVVEKGVLNHSEQAAPGVLCVPSTPEGVELRMVPKRGKDIKTFADLPPDVQQTIDSLSMVDGKICQRVKANRTAIAINYQHLFPDRFHSTGVAV